jgi:hypothetical protein
LEFKLQLKNKASKQLKKHLCSLFTELTGAFLFNLSGPIELSLVHMLNRLCFTIGKQLGYRDEPIAAPLKLG